MARLAAAGPGRGARRATEAGSSRSGGRPRGSGHAAVDRGPPEPDQCGAGPHGAIARRGLQDLAGARCRLRVARRQPSLYPFRARHAGPSETFDRGERYEFADRDLDLAQASTRDCDRQSRRPRRSARAAGKGSPQAARRARGAGGIRAARRSGTPTSRDFRPRWSRPSVERERVRRGRASLELRREADALRLDLSRSAGGSRKPSSSSIPRRRGAGSG